MPFRPAARRPLRLTGAPCLLFAASAAWAQLPGAAVPAIDAPWYVGAAQGFAHDSNVARAPGGEGDTLSSTSLLAGFDQRLGRQRLYGQAGVTLNRYFDQSRYDNTAYDLLAGLDWQTVQNLSGKVEAGLDSRLVRPAAGAPGADDERNLERTQRLQATARWGGASLLTLEGTAGYARIDQSADAYAAQESRATAGSFGLHWNGGGPLRLGIVGRYDTVRWPSALDDGAGNVQADRVNSRGVELVASYDDRGVVAGRARIGYVRSTHSNEAFDDADFSGLAGSVAVDVRATGKLTLRGWAARDPSLNPLTSTPAVPDATLPATGGGTGSGAGAGAGGSATQPIYQRNVVTNTVGAGAEWQATSRIAVTSRLQYSRAHLVTLDGDGAGTDTRKTAGLGARYEITRAIGLGCGYEHEQRRVTGASSGAYSANAVGCTLAVVLR